MKYILVSDKIYEITKISFFYMTVEAKETNLTIDDVPESEVWDIEEFKYYKVTLNNNSRKREVIDFNEWKQSHKELMN